jgi:methyl acetate hydrolase
METSMAALDTVIQNAVARQDLPFAVAATANAAGTTWTGAAGDAAPGLPASNSTLFRIFSMTKSVGSLAAMILMDRGLISPDTTVQSILPEFAQLQLLTGYAGDVPQFRAPRVQATLRHLATHTSGLAYEFWNADSPRCLAAAGNPGVLSGNLSSMHYPLVFEPGEGWAYGIGIDWLGRVVEKVDGRRIDQFCRDEIFGPLKMNETGFEVEPHMAARLAAVKIRGEDGQFADFAIAPPSMPEFYGMGHALYSTAPDYLRFLRLFLNHGTLDGARIISAAGLEKGLANQIGHRPIPVMKSQAPPLTADVDLFPGTRKSHSLAFMRFEDDIPGMRRAGSMGWAGVLNTHYWIDPASNLTGVLMTQSLPFVEPRFIATYQAFERAAYAE